MLMLVFCDDLLLFLGDIKKERWRGMKAEFLIATGTNLCMRRSLFFGAAPIGPFLCAKKDSNLWLVKAVHLHATVQEN